ncbi:MAG: type II secretion system secretin GspD [Burkholderiaceae bacterium]|nr:type II secretion system secretin GspD [Burkholderiaceae bacterium]
MLNHRHVLIAVALIASQVSCATADGVQQSRSASTPEVSASASSSDATISPAPALRGESLAKPPEDSPSLNKQVTVLGTDRVIAARPATSAVAGPASSFKFEETPITDVAHVILGQILKVDYVLHKPLNGTVTLTTKGSVSADQAAALLEGALQANGLLMARDGRGVYHVGRAEALKGIVSAPRQSGNGTLPPGYGAVIVPLENIGAAEMASILRPMLPPEALVRVDTLRNLLVLAGTRNQAEGWLEIVSTFDIDLLKGMSIGVFPLKYASIKDVESALRMITPGTAQAPAGASGLSASSPAAGIAPAGTSLEMPALLGGVRILPIERINSIIAVTSKAARLEDVRRWIERLDQPTNSSETQLFVYPVQNGSAQHLAAVLNGIYGSDPRSSSPTSSTTGVAPGLTSVTASQGQQGSGFGYSGSGSGSGTTTTLSRQGSSNSGNSQAVTSVTLAQGTRLMADELNNAILVYGNRSEYMKIEDTLRKLDVPPTQVLIEASIIEVTLNDDLKYGVQWLFNDTSGSNTGTGVLSTGNGGVLGGPLAGFSYSLRNSAGNVRAVLNALAEKSLVKVISSPSLMVLDNHTAAIAVGNQQPIRSAVTIATGGLSTTSIEYKDTGVSLAVTPSVNAGNIVTMQINQGVTDVGQIDTATGQRTFLQRRIDSKVAIRSGETLVLGGLIRDNTTTGKSGIPLLQDIPVLGNLFGSNTTNTARTELLVVITPRVVRSDQEIRDVSGEMRARMKSFSAPGAPLIP